MFLVNRRLPGRKLRTTQKVTLAIALVAVASLFGAAVHAAVTTVGDVAPAPPGGGGAFAGPFRVGLTDFGSVTIAGGTGISHTNVAVIGDTLTGIGIVTMSGLNSDWTLTTSTADLTVANNGTGSLTVANLAVMTVPDMLFVAAQNDSLGEISISGLGTMMSADETFIGQRGQAIVTISDGGRLLSSTNIIGDEALGDGQVIVQDQLSLWRATSTMTVADAGRALLQILDGARVDNTTGNIGNLAGSHGTVEVAGLGSVWDNSAALNIGNAGNGTLIIADGARVNTNSGGGINLSRIGVGSSGHGVVEVRGTDSLWTTTTSGLLVGVEGDGELRILDGGRVTGGNVFAGVGVTNNSRGTIIIDGVDSSLSATGELNLGAVGLGTVSEGNVTISGGGLASVVTAVRVTAQGRFTLDGGRVDITGPMGFLNFGVTEGNGVVEGPVTNNVGGHLRPWGVEPLLLTSTLTNSGLIDVQSSELEVIGATTNNADIDARDGAILRFRSTGLDNNSGSQLAITTGIVDVFGLVDNNAGAEIAVGGTAVGVFHDAVTNNGTIFVQPGGEILMLEDLAFSPGAAALRIQLQDIDLTDTDTQPSDAFGQVQVGGAAALAGTLEVSLLDGYMPMAGDSFQILTAGGGRTGMFGTEILPALAVGLEWDVQYNPNSVVLAVTAPGLIGDYNDDGAVDAADYVVWRKFNNTMTTLPNDSTPGDVDDGDYDEWREHFGETAGAGANANGTVPEPATMVILILAVAFASCACGGKVTTPFNRRGRRI
jgi:T5SS/PEP-CTERM-associated repeat protein